MGTQIQIHPVQAKILRELLFKPEARFSELNIEGLTSDHFTFHINQLIDSDLINKVSNGKYGLTTKGKEFANRLDTDTARIERQPKIGVLVVATQGIGKNTKYLVQKRLKQPYYNFTGFMTGKIRWGETAKETALRETKEETGLSAEIKFSGIKHKMDYSMEGALLEDKFFFVFWARKVKGTLKEKFEGGENKWLTEKEIFNIPDLFDGVKDSIEMVKNSRITFLETKYQVKKY